MCLNGRFSKIQSHILIQASQLYKASALTRVERQGDMETGDEVSPAIMEHGFSSPKSASEVENVNSLYSRKPSKTLSGLKKTWFLWTTQRLKKCNLGINSK